MNVTSSFFGTYCYTYKREDTTFAYNASKEILDKTKAREADMIRLCVREMAQDRGIRQIDLAKKTGLTTTIISNYWHNKVRRISLETLEAIGAALGVSGTNLLADTPLSTESSSPMRLSLLKKPVHQESEEETILPPDQYAL